MGILGEYSIQGSLTIIWYPEYLLLNVQNGIGQYFCIDMNDRRNISVSVSISLRNRSFNQSKNPLGTPLPVRTYPSYLAFSQA